MEKQIAVLAGDGIGEEVMEQALRVLKVINDRFKHQFVIKQGLIGGAAYDVHGNHFPEETKKLCESSDAILFGSVGGPVGETKLDKWKNCEINSILAIRKHFSFYANFRPVRIYKDLAQLSPLKNEIIEKGIDMLLVRELLGDSYFGEHKNIVEDGKRIASDLSIYSEDQIKAVAHISFQAAQKRRKHLTCVDKANVLDVSRLWRKVVHEVGQEYPDVEIEDCLVDNCAMQIIKNPSHFDVLVLPNMFGDILSDAAAVLPGSLGLLASASFNEKGFALYEPPGGSAQDIAGKGIANPIAQILSVSMMLRYSFGLMQESLLVEKSVEHVLKEGFRTKDIHRGEGTLVGSKEITDQMVAWLCSPLCKNPV